jgi:hypothetical protein
MNFGADNETGFWFWADYVNPAYQRGTAQEFANLASSQPCTLPDRKAYRQSS